MYLNKENIIKNLPAAVDAMERHFFFKNENTERSIDNGGFTEDEIDRMRNGVVPNKVFLVVEAKNGCKVSVEIK